MAEAEFGLISQRTKCTCGHIHRRHYADGLHGCRRSDCRCEEFVAVRGVNLEVLGAIDEELLALKERALAELALSLRGDIEAGMGVDMVVGRLGDKLTEVMRKCLAAEFELVSGQFWMEVIRNPEAADSTRSAALRDLGRLLGKFSAREVAAAEPSDDERILSLQRTLAPSSVEDS